MRARRVYGQRPEYSAHSRHVSAGMIHRLITRDWPSGAYAVLVQRSGLTGRLLVKH
jgi:hypothetical protein